MSKSVVGNRSDVETAVLPSPAALSSSGEFLGTNADERRQERRGRVLFFGGPFYFRRAGEKEALILALICALDMYSTLWWVLHGEAREANPLLAWTFHYHPIVFILTKSITFLPALYLLTVAAQKRRHLSVRMMRLAILAYVTIYLFTAR
ncbi:MAG: DUF5658 family protein [Capsulimonadales bacterium]|nr:DUF5658 family protein [Capsulimonadales bacterium]